MVGERFRSYVKVPRIGEATRRNSGFGFWDLSSGVRFSARNLNHFRQGELCTELEEYSYIEIASDSGSRQVSLPIQSRTFKNLSLRYFGRRIFAVFADDQYLPKTSCD